MEQAIAKGGKKLEKVWKKYREKDGEFLDQSKFQKFFGDFCVGMRKALVKETQAECERKTKVLFQSGGVTAVRDNQAFYGCWTKFLEFAWHRVAEETAGSEILFSLMTNGAGRISWEHFDLALKTSWEGIDDLMRKFDCYNEGLKEGFLDWRYVRAHPEWIKEKLVEEIIHLPTEKSVAIQYRNHHPIIFEVDPDDDGKDFKVKAMETKGCWQTDLAHRMDLELDGRLINLKAYTKNPPKIKSLGIIPGKSIMFDIGRN